ncbi:MAG TPA: hypothetical protein VIL85_17070 [Thermomicrobiales bacterium]
MSPRRLILAGLLCLALLCPLAPISAHGGVSAAEEACFSETDQCVAEPFLTYWRTRGGLAIHGYPISAPFRERLADGKEYVVQYFERSRFEFHPENAAPYDVLLGQFGRTFYLTDPSLPTANIAAPLPDATYFRETGHNVGGRFLAYWQANGGLAQFGYPLSEELREILEDGREYTVQYFERARFERHPTNPPPYDVLLGQFGRRILGALVPPLSVPFPVPDAIGAKYGSDASLRARLGLPLSAAQPIQGAAQSFERGALIWRADTRQIYAVIREDSGGSTPIGAWAVYSDTWREGDAPGGGQAPVGTMYLPQRGFGKVWRENPDLQRLLGYALTPDERGQPLAIQSFSGGLALGLPGTGRYDDNTFLLYNNGRYESNRYP